MSSRADAVLKRVDRLAGITAYPWTLTRRVFTPEQAEAEALVLGWMQDAGLDTHRDPAGALVGRIEGETPGGPAVVIGGHIDMAEGACRFDGVLGVLIGIACAERLVEDGARLRRAVEVVAFAEDVAGRFGLQNFGTRAAAGRWNRGALDHADGYDVTLRQAMQAHGLDPERFQSAKRDPSDVATYLEVSAEPGPLLEEAGVPLGIVEALTEASLLRVTLKGIVGDAVSLPMSGRRDALTGAAECVLEVERTGLSRPGLTATVVRLDAEALPSFVTHGSVTFGALFASRDDEPRRAATAEAATSFEAIARRRGLEIIVEHGIDPDAVRCDPAAVRQFERAAAASGQRSRIMGTTSSGAFHMSSIGPIGLLLIRARGATGWGPGAEVSVDDIAAGVDVLCRAVLALAGDAPSDAEP